MADPTKTAGSVKIQTPKFTISGPPKQGQRYIKFMVYGDFGCGKTTLAASAVDADFMGDVLFVDAESGEMTLDDNPRIKNADRIDRVRISNFEQVAHIREYLKAHCAARDRNDIEKLRALQAMVFGVDPADIADDQIRRYRCVILDSLSEINEYCMYQLLKLSTDMHLDLDNMDVAEWPQFRKANQMMQLTIRAYRDLPMHLILVASSQFTQDETKRKMFAPNLTGKLAGQVQGFMDLVGYLVTGKADEKSKIAPRRLYVQPVGNFAAKNRRSVYQQAYIDNPVMSDIMGLLRLTPEK